MPRFKSITFITITLKLIYFCKKMQNFQVLGALPPDPRVAVPASFSGDVETSMEVTTNER